MTIISIETKKNNNNIIINIWRKIFIYLFVCVFLFVANEIQKATATTPTSAQQFKCEKNHKKYIFRLLLTSAG